MRVRGFLCFFPAILIFSGNALCADLDSRGFAVGFQYSSGVNQDSSMIPATVKVIPETYKALEGLIPDLQKPPGESGFAVMLLTDNTNRDNGKVNARFWLSSESTLLIIYRIQGMYEGANVKQPSVLHILEEMIARQK